MMLSQPGNGLGESLGVTAELLGAAIGAAVARWAHYAQTEDVALTEVPMPTPESVKNSDFDRQAVILAGAVAGYWLVGGA